MFSAFIIAPFAVIIYVVTLDKLFCISVCQFYWIRFILTGLYDRLNFYIERITQFGTNRKSPFEFNIGQYQLCKTNSWSSLGAHWHLTAVLSLFSTWLARGFYNNLGGCHLISMVMTRAMWSKGDITKWHHMSRMYLCGFIKWATTWQNRQNECAPSKDSDQPGHPPSLISVFTVRMKKSWALSYPLSAQWRLWSDWADVQTDLSLRWAHTHFVGFVMSWLKFCWSSAFETPFHRTTALEHRSTLGR